jgi:hypothetical protein
MFFVELTSDVRYVPFGGNLPANYKGCTVYKDLQKRTYPPLHLKQYTHRAQIKHTLYTQPGVTYTQISNQNSYPLTNIEQEPHINQPHQQTSNIQQDLKNMTKSLFEQMETMQNLFATVLTKLK